MGRRGVDGPGKQEGKPLYGPATAWTVRGPATMQTVWFTVRTGWLAWLACGVLPTLDGV